MPKHIAWWNSSLSARDEAAVTSREWHAAQCCPKLLVGFSVCAVGCITFITYLKTIAQLSLHLSTLRSLLELGGKTVQKLHFLHRLCSLCTTWKMQWRAQGKRQLRGSVQHRHMKAGGLK